MRAAAHCRILACGNILNWGAFYEDSQSTLTWRTIRWTCHEGWVLFIAITAPITIVGHPPSIIRAT